MKFCAAVVLTFATATASSDRYNRSLHPQHCPPPQSPPPPPRADGRPWVWVCRPKPSSSHDRYPNDGPSSASEDVEWQDDGYDDDATSESDQITDDWGNDGHVEADDSTWDDDGHVDAESEQITDDWGNDGHVEADDSTWDDDGHVEADDEGWDGDGYEEMPLDEGIEEVDSLGDEDGEEEVDSWGDDETADRQPALSDSLLEEGSIHHEQDSMSVPIGAIAGAAAAAVVAAIIALAVVRRRKNDEQFVDVDDKDSIGTTMTPPPEARMANDDDIEIDHTFFDENLFQENYREQELAYSDLYPQEDLSTINEDLGYTGDDVSI